MKGMNPIWKACLEANDRANDVYEEAVAQAKRDWEKATAPATKSLNIAIAQAWNICQETKAKNFETFNPQGPIFALCDEIRTS